MKKSLYYFFINILFAMNLLYPYYPKFVPYARRPALIYGVQLNKKLAFKAGVAIMCRRPNGIINPVADGCAPPFRIPPPLSVFVYMPFVLPVALNIALRAIADLPF